MNIFSTGSVIETCDEPDAQQSSATSAKRKFRGDSVTGRHVTQATPKRLPSQLTALCRRLGSIRFEPFDEFVGPLNVPC